MLQADGRSGSHARPAWGGERVSVLEPSPLGAAVPAGIPGAGGPQCAAATVGGEYHAGSVQELQVNRSSSLSSGFTDM